MKKVAVVILNYNGKAYLEQFLPSVLNCTPSSVADIVVADNASTDDSLSLLKNKFPEVNIIINSSNGGYAKGYNDALSKLNHEYFLLLNSDIEVTAHWIQPLLTLLENNAEIAAAQPKILSFHNKQEFEYAGAAGGYIDKFGYPFCRGRIFNSFEEDKGQYDDKREVFWATGACLFVRRSCFIEAGKFDEDFFAHMEEIDLCWRMKNLGHKIFYCPESTIYHVGGGTLSKNNPQKTYLNFRNNLVLLFKNHASSFFSIKILLRLILDGMAGFKFIFSGDYRHCISVLRAHYYFYRHFSTILHKRQSLKMKVKVFTRSCIYNRSIVLDYFVFNRKRFSQLKNKYFYK